MGALNKKDQKGHKETGETKTAGKPFLPKQPAKKEPGKKEGDISHSIHGAQGGKEMKGEGNEGNQDAEDALVKYFFGKEPENIVGSSRIEKQSVEIPGRVAVGVSACQQSGAEAEKGKSSITCTG